MCMSASILFGSSNNEQRRRRDGCGAVLPFNALPKLMKMSTWQLDLMPVANACRCTWHRHMDGLLIHLHTTDDLTVSWHANCKVNVGTLHSTEALSGGRGGEKMEDEV